jgi:hypothetical protein
LAALRAWPSARLACVTAASSAAFGLADSVVSADSAAFASPDRALALALALALAAAVAGTSPLAVSVAPLITASASASACLF